MTQTNTIDPAEVAKFEAMAAEWWDVGGKFKPLLDILPDPEGALAMWRQVRPLEGGGLEEPVTVHARRAPHEPIGALQALRVTGAVAALVVVAHNGGESFKHAKLTRALGLPVHRLPSTSPANASWTLARKLEAWREVFQAAGLSG